MTLAINIESYIKISVGTQTIVLNFGTESDCRVEDRRGGLRLWGVAVAGSFRHVPVSQSIP